MSTISITVPTTPVLTSLNRLLSNYKIYFHKLLRYQWLVQASEYPELNEDFHQYAEEAEERIDHLVGHIENLGGVPVGSWSRWQSSANIEFKAPVEGAFNMLSKILEDTQQLHHTSANLKMSAYRTQERSTIALVTETQECLSTRIEELESALEMVHCVAV